VRSPLLLLLHLIIIIIIIIIIFFSLSPSRLSLSLSPSLSCLSCLSHSIVTLSAHNVTERRKRKGEILRESNVSYPSESSMFLAARTGTKI
jgi:hypothetical protein